ncbi:hypothetical protein B0J14DRAFT_662862 [Halenospora varia]|nr:hypothetical protein B0J14DRAFT_662862 [Halenospora varia]
MENKSGRLALRETFTPRLTITVMLIAFSQFNFGFEQQGFAATQAMDAFDRQFGTFNRKTKTYVLEPKWLSLFNPLNYIGFGFVFLGGFSFPLHVNLAQLMSLDWDIFLSLLDQLIFCQTIIA